jgi:Mg-chelatase subunit ChlD
MKRLAFAAFAFVCLVPAASAAMRTADLASNTEVDVALVLAVDASSSMDTGERRLQRKGYATALTSRPVLDAIEHGTQHRIAVIFFEWGSTDQQVIVAPWQIVDGPEAARNLAKTISETPSQDLQRTSISAALEFAGTLLAQSGLKAERQVIDVSGDGPNNDGMVVSDARDRIIARGISINGLPIVTKSTTDMFSIPDLDQYYEHCVIGGEGSFMIPVRGMENFSKALELKLVMEIAGIRQDRPRVMPAGGRDWSTCHIYD